MSEIYDIILILLWGWLEETYKPGTSQPPNEYNMSLLTECGNYQLSLTEKSIEKDQKVSSIRGPVFCSAPSVSASLIKEKQSLKTLTAWAQTTSLMIWWSLKLSLGTVSFIWLPKMFKPRRKYTCPCQGLAKCAPDWQNTKCFKEWGNHTTPAAVWW